ncbi:hypothetical protein [Vibrio sp. MA40-2]|uniref:hypothetical protein n=1 Tax=Vibrio sp. MA40-2 TaxID=3391828 RepID=UPI0039A4FF91
MTPVGNANASTVPVSQTKRMAAELQSLDTKQPLTQVKAEQNTVTLSHEGKALLSALQQIDKESTPADEPKPSSVESFAHGALGLNQPGESEEKQDSSYSAGQFVKGALSVGAVLLAVL